MAAIWKIIWELTAVNSHRSVYLMEVSAAKGSHIAFYSWNILLFSLGRKFLNERKDPSLCFRTEKTLLSCLQTASLLTLDDLVLSPQSRVVWIGNSEILWPVSANCWPGSHKIISSTPTKAGSPNQADDFQDDLSMTWDETCRISLYIIL